MVSANSSDNVQVVKTDILINHQRIATTNSASLTYTWNTSRLAKGTYTRQSIATDSSGNQATSPPVRVLR